MVSLPEILLPKKNYFGLSIERTMVAAVELDEYGKPMKMAGVQIPPDTFVDGFLSKKDVLLTAIKSIWTKGKFSTPYVAVCFPEAFAYTRGATIPMIPLEEVQEAITWRSKELFPFPQVDIYFDWKILKKSINEYQVIVVAVQRKLLDDLVWVLVQAGLKPLRFEPDASALVRLLKIESDKHALLVEINPKGAYVTLVEGEKAIFTTVIPYGDQDTPANYLSNIDQTLLEISQFYTKKGMLQEKSTIGIVAGDMASPQWVSHFGQILKYPFTLLATPVNQQKFNKAYAGAVQKIASPIDPQSINVLPTATQAYYDRQQTLQFYKTIFARFGVVAFFICLASISSYIFVSLKRTQLEKQASTIRSLTQSQQTDTQLLLLLNAQARNITALSPLRKTPASFIRPLATMLTDGITVTQWEYDDSKLMVKLTGMAATREALLTLKDELELSKIFANVNLPLESLETPVRVPFVMTFLLAK